MRKKGGWEGLLIWKPDIRLLAGIFGMEVWLPSTELILREL